MTQTVTIIQGTQLGSNYINANSITWADTTTWGNYSNWRVANTQDVIVRVEDNLGVVDSYIPNCLIDAEGDISIALSISDTGAFAGEQSTIDFVANTEYTFSSGRYFRWEFTASNNSEYDEPIIFDFQTSYTKQLTTEILNGVEVYAQEDSDGFYSLPTNLGNVLNIQATALQGGAYVVDGYLLEKQGDDYTRTAVPIENSADESQTPLFTDRLRFIETDQARTGRFAMVTSDDLDIRASMQADIGEEGLNYGTSDWCYEAWVKPDPNLWNDGNRSPYIFQTEADVTDPDWVNFIHMSLVINPGIDANNFAVDTSYYVAGTQYSLNIGYELDRNSWHHLAFQRKGTQLEIYANGVLKNTQAISSSDTFNLGGSSVNICGLNPLTSFTSSQYFKGYIDEMRISTSARYSDGYTPQTTPLVNDPTTQLLINAESTSEPDLDGKPVIVDNNGESFGIDNYIIVQKSGSPVIESKNPPKIRLTDGEGNLWDGAVDAVLRGYPKIQLETDGVSTIPIENTGG